MPRRCAARADAAAAARPAVDHGARRRPLVGRRASPLGPPVAGGGARPGDRAGRGRLPGVGRAHRRRRGHSSPRSATSRGAAGLEQTGAARAAVAPGERVRLPALARTLRTLADQGFDAYYDGELGERIVRGLDAAGAPFTLADLREHRSTWGRPIETTYRGVRVTTHPPNSSGLIALEILNVLERFAPARARASAGAAGPIPRGSTSSSRRPSSPSPTATRTSPIPRRTTSRSTGCARQGARGGPRCADRCPPRRSLAAPGAHARRRDDLPRRRRRRRATR